jgi:serine/threonine protein kinase
VGCLSEEETLAYVRGGGALDPEVVLAHLENCQACRITVGEAARDLPEHETSRIRSGPPEASRPRIAAEEARERDPTTLSPGERVADRYEILRFVDRGGMGEVYEARDHVLGEIVALKTLACTVLDDRRAMKRLMAEVRLARRVTHPNVCRIMEFGLYRPRGGREEIPFLTMPFLRGETMDQRIERHGWLSPAVALRYLDQIAAGLDAIHAEGIVHRDIKPQNIFLLPGAEERVVLMDFGLARSLDPALGLSFATTQKSVAGTLDYMAPEQLEAKPPTARCDVFAVGVLLYQMVTGRKPYRSSSIMTAMAERVQHPPPPPSKIATGLGSDWDRTIMRCLAYDPGQRFASVREIAEALSGSRPRAKSVRAWVETIVLVLLAVSIAWRLFRGPQGATLSGAAVDEAAAPRQAAPADSAAMSGRPIGSNSPAEGVMDQAAATAAPIDHEPAPLASAQSAPSARAREPKRATPKPPSKPESPGDPFESME